MSEGAQLLTVQQVAERLQVHPKTVGEWLRNGTLIGIRLGPGRTSEWRVAPQDLERFISERRTGTTS